LKPYVKIKFFSNIEILGFFFSSLMVASLLFPMGKIEELIFNAPDFNIELSEIYLKNLIKVNPNTRLKLAIAQRYIKTGKIEIAYDILTSLRNLKNPGLRSQALDLSYEILKWRYLWAKDRLQRDYIKKQIARCVRKRLIFISDANLLEPLFNDLISLNMPHLAMLVAKKIFLIRGKKNTKMLRKLADAFLWQGEYKKSIYLYEEIISVQKKTEEKEKTFRKMARILMWNKDYKELKRILLKYMPKFLNDEDMIFFCLRVALSTGDPYFARNLLLEALKSQP